MVAVERDEERTELVVAYWSFDYRDHPMGYLTRGLFCAHQASTRFPGYNPIHGCPTLNMIFSSIRRADHVPVDTIIVRLWCESLR